MELPPTLKRGDVARLFPVIAETGKEQRATSIFLSVLSAVPPFSSAILSELGVKTGNRTLVNTFTEIEFQGDGAAGGADRPDGLIEVVKGKRKWYALVEVKIGSSDLGADQVKRYLYLARANSVDAVVTISNQFAARPHHHPVAVGKKLTQKVSLYHLSWTSVLTSAVFLQERTAIVDPEQAFLLREFIRFFSHPSAGISPYSSMPKEWSAMVKHLRAGGRVSGGEIGDKVVGGWHQELRNLTLIMSRIMGCTVGVKLSRSHENDPNTRLKNEVDDLRKNGKLAATLNIPDAASDLKIIADIESRIIRVSMTVNAPLDKKKNISRLNWILRQMKADKQENVSVKSIWASTAQDTLFTLAELKLRPELIGEVAHSSKVRAFEIILTTDSASRVAGRRTFIEELEGIVPRYYETIGQHLKNWTPSPPKPKHSVIVVPETKSEILQDQNITSENRTVQPAGNNHSDLLETPQFLRRSELKYEE